MAKAYPPFAVNQTDSRLTLKVYLSFLLFPIAHTKGKPTIERAAGGHIFSKNITYSCLKT